MLCNMGKTDRMIRAVAGVVLVGCGLAGLIGPWGWLGLIPLATAAVGVCPAYLPFGLSTVRRKR